MKIKYHRDNEMKTKKLNFLGAIFLVQLFLINFAFAVTNTSFTIDSTQTNQNSSYTFGFRISNNGSAKLNANVDTIYVRFPSGFTVPGSINASSVTVQNTQPLSVGVNGNTLAILIPVSITSKNTPVTVNIKATANITNPSTAGNYAVDIATNKEPTYVTSPTATVVASTSSVSPASVAPNPSIASEAAAYNISFNVGSSGALTASSSIVTIHFPSDTYVPTGGVSGVTFNNTTASANAAGDSVNITAPVNVSNNGAVTIKFDIGSGLKNPSNDSTYTLSVYTSAETSPVTSDQYTISPAGQLSITAISTYPDTVNMNKDYVMEFRTGSSGALSSVSDTIYIIFPYNSYVPSNITTSGITVESGGFSDNAYNIVEQNLNKTDDDTLLIVPNVNIGANSDVTVTISASAGLLAPSISGNYSLGLQTSAESPFVQSNPFTIFDAPSKITVTNVTPASSQQNAVTSYSIDFDTGKFGRLKSGASTITFTFNSLFIVSETASDYNDSKIIVGTDTTSISVTGSDISPSNTNKTVIITVPASVEILNKTAVNIILAGTATDPIRNANNQQNYQLEVKTSVEPTPVYFEYNIGGTPITINSITLTDSSVNKASGYTFNITTQNPIANIDNPGQQPDTKDQVVIIFPEGTVIPSSISTSTVTISGNAPESITVSVADRKISLTVGPAPNITINAGTFDVVLSSSAGIVNPIVPATDIYKVTMYTSTDQVPVKPSWSYGIHGNATSVTAQATQVVPTVINADPAKYIINFATTTNGKIAGGQVAGSSTITLIFDSGTIIPTSINPSSVKVNNNATQSVTVLTSGSAGKIQLDVPDGLVIGNSTNVSVEFDTPAGLKNGTTAGSYNIGVQTSSDTMSTNVSFTLTATQDLTVTSVTPSPTIQNSAASYSIKFTTGSSGALSIGDSIDVTFPVNTFVPASINKSDIQINNNTPTTNPVVLGQKVTFKTPVAVGNLSSVTILINSSSGILNPTNTGSYTATVSTQTENTPGFTSPAYNISAASTTVSAATVTPGDGGTSNTTFYKVNFNVGSNGRLIGGTSTITIDFNASTTVSTTTANYNASTIKVNSGTGVSIASNIAISGQVVTVTVPASVSITNSDNVEILLDGATDPITNPASSGSYTLQVKTSVETSYISSNSYSISNVGPLGASSVFLSPDTVNAIGFYQVDFQVDATAGALTAGSGTISISFPNNTYVPSSISAANVEIRQGANLSGTPSNPNTVSTNPTERSVTLTVSTAIANSDSVRVSFLTGAGIENPSVSGAGAYTLQVSTSSQTIASTSQTYSTTNTGTSVTINSIDIQPNTPSNSANFTVNFTTGYYGRLVSGTSYIDIIFPVDATFTQGTPAASKVVINSTAAKSVELIGGTPPFTLRAVISSSVTIGNSSAVTVVIDSTSGFQNASSTSALTYQVSTSVEHLTSGTMDHSLPVELTSFGAKSSNSVVYLNWVTESELNNAYWIIERNKISAEQFELFNEGSLKLSEIMDGFNDIDDIQGRGTTSYRTEYQYKDSLVVVGNHYLYRIADVAYDGRVTYHGPVAVEVNPPNEYKLAQNYPNPFNPTTTIRFNLPAQAKVSLVVYDVLGREIYKVIDRQIIPAGNHEIQWAGRNKAGHQVASGIYFYRIQANNFSAIRKMILLK